ncbi:hypothetical protein PUN28_018677 [Cardiocondyla obscurior]|uniref:Secreted protein n=1 Tax=Cardiocondyla obscurior TaxID=286306 RepID=A0AAW2EHQ8_9HYME
MINAIESNDLFVSCVLLIVPHPLHGGDLSASHYRNYSCLESREQRRRLSSLSSRTLSDIVVTKPGVGFFTSRDHLHSRCITEETQNPRTARDLEPRCHIPRY